MKYKLASVTFQGKAMYEISVKYFQAKKSPEKQKRNELIVPFCKAGKGLDVIFL
jgi:hypothetical protein